ncbi:hypothetical protein IW150_006279 [Coemansia sp. RSA 2607]|nr:hypothetical protein IW150_006279 [Coemansia sp. RSA 2607]
MMEMFTPERKKPAATENLFLIPEADEDNDDYASGLTTEMKSNARALRRTSRPTGDPSTPVVADAIQPPSENRKRDSLLNTSRINLPVENKAKTPITFTKIALSAKPDHTTPKLNGTTAPVAPAVADTAITASVRKFAADNRPNAPTTPEPNSTPVAAPTGLNAVSSNVFQNLVSDALLPLREQLSGEIRNLHLDMIRQDFVYQEQIKVLRAECSEARALRREIDQLRRENEQLKRYLPFYNFTDAEMLTPAADSGVQGQPAML